MKKLLSILVLFAFAYSCNGPTDDKKLSTPAEEIATKIKKDKERKEKEKDKIVCDWDGKIKKFNKPMRGEEFDIDTAISKAPLKGKRGKKPVVVEPPPIDDEAKPISGFVIFIDHWGMLVSNTMWNVYGDFTVTHSGFAQSEIDAILVNVKAHFAGFNITVTSSEQDFNRATLGKKIRISLTEYNEWYGSGAGGVAYLNSLFWTDGSPAFVFTKLLGYSVHNVAEAAAHEAGHTIGLRHQVDCVNGVVTNGYSYGPTMGNSYGSYPIGYWKNGTSSAACNWQMDSTFMANKLGAVAAIGIQ